jgi:simple sugar transport system substrate-binding protein
VRQAVWAVLLAVAVGVTAACGDDEQGSEGRADIRIVFVSHGQASDPFWSVVANGVNDAAADLGVEVEYEAPSTFDPARMSQLIDDARDSRPSGLVVTLPDAEALAESLQAVVAAGVPVLSVNSGDDVWKSLGLLGHIGQAEYEAAFAGGRRLAEAGARKVLCVNHEAGNASLDLRCRGLDDALQEAGGTSSVLEVNPADREDAQGRVAEALDADPEIDAILALGPSGALPTAEALRATGRLGSLLFGTFDLGPDILGAVRDGDILFAIDQLPYMQGYLAVTLMVKYLETGAVPGGGQIIRTGPAFVTRETAEDAIRLAEQGRR